MNKQEEDEIKPWDFKLSENERLGGFGFFRMWKQDSDNEKLINNFMNDLIRQIDEKFGHDERLFYGLQYKLQAILSIMNDPKNKINQRHKPMPHNVEKLYYHLRNLIARFYSDNKISNSLLSGPDRYLDHVFWYYMDPNDKRYVVIEAHPYLTLDDDDIHCFSEIMKQDPSLKVQIRPDSHYFANWTIYLKFIFDTKGQ